MIRIPCLAITLALAVPVEVVGQNVAASADQPLGRMVDIGGRQLHIHCSGSGRPTVILLAGGGAYSFDWALVQASASSATRICSYDRAGTAWSDSGPSDETVEQTVTDLDLLLKAAGEHAPYVLVGASIGGMYIRAFQHAFPDKVAGLIFANSVSRLGKVTPSRSGLLWDLSEDEIRSAYPLPATISKGPRPSRTSEPFDRLPVELQRLRLTFELRRWESWSPASVGPEADLSWRREMLRQLEQSCSGLLHPLGTLPTIVLASDQSASELAERGTLNRQFCDRSDAEDGLELLSSNSDHIVAEGSGHEIHLHQPQLLVQAIQRLVAAVRDGGRLQATRDP